MRLKPWNIDWVVRNTVRRLTGRKTLEQERQERVALLREMLYPGESKVAKPGLTREYFGKLAHDFGISNVTLAQRTGAVVAASSRTDVSQNKGAFDSVSKLIPNAKYLLIKDENKTRIIYPNNGSLLMVEARGSVSPIEMKALMRQIKKGESS